MIKKRILQPGRVRRIDGGFSFIPHRFLTDGFLAALDQKELLLYLFLVLVCDRYGLSFYSYDSICSLLKLQLDQYIQARDGLIDFVSGAAALQAAAPAGTIRPVFGESAERGRRWRRSGHHPASRSGCGWFYPPSCRFSWAPCSSRSCRCRPCLPTAHRFQ